MGVFNILQSYRARDGRAYSMNGGGGGCDRLHTVRAV